MSLCYGHYWNLGFSYPSWDPRCEKCHEESRQRRNATEERSTQQHNEIITAIDRATEELRKLNDTENSPPQS